MGMRLWSANYVAADAVHTKITSTDHDRKVPKVKARNPCDPDPHNFEIVSVDHISDWTIAVVKYHDCVNYNGHKLLVWDFPLDLTKLKTLDPHFLGLRTSPVARFEPTPKGIRQAKRLVLSYTEET